MAGWSLPGLRTGRLTAIPESRIICINTEPGRNMEALLVNSHGRVWDIDTGHDLMITEPDWVTARLLDVAEVVQ